MSEFEGIGFDEPVEEKDEDTIVSFEEAKKHKMPWHSVTMCGNEYKLKLTTASIIKLEKKYKCNVMDLFMEGIPELSIMLTVFQASLEKYHHGMGTEKVINLYDAWCEEEDGSQTALLKKVLMPTLAVSGFFEYKQAQELLTELEAENDL